jgi:hypothetical protein
MVAHSTYIVTAGYYSDAGGQSIGSAKEHQRDKDKGILKTHITAQYTVS